MSRLEVEFELTGLKFKVVGERDDVAGALANLQQQVAALAQSAGTAAHLQDDATLAPKVATTAAILEAPTRQLPSPSVGRSRMRKRDATKAAEAIEFHHDAEKLGFPKQEWNTATKAMWLIYMLEKQTDAKEASAAAIQATFNKYFKQFGNILKHNVTRDLGNAKSKNGFVNTDSSKDPETWYLLSEGKKHIETLIQVTSSEESNL